MNQETKKSEDGRAAFDLDLDAVAEERPKPQLSKEELAEAGVRAGFTKPSAADAVETVKRRRKRGAAAAGGEQSWRRTTALSTKIKAKHHEQLVELVDVLSDKEERPISKAEVLERSLELLYGHEIK